MKLKLMMMFGQLVLSTSLLADPWFGKAEGHNRVEKAHQAFLKEQFLLMGKHVKDALQDEGLSAVEKENLLDLMTKAFRVNNGKLPADWRLPAEIQRLYVEVIRQERNGDVSFNLSLKGYGIRKNLIRQLRVIKFPGQVVIDKANNVGEWEDEVWQGQPEFTAESEKTSAKVQDGLYFLSIVLDDGQRTEGWFVLNNINASASPVVHTPGEGEVFHTANPVTEFENFRSPEYQSHERRTLSVNMTRLYPERDEWEYLWGFYADNPTLTQVELGTANGDQSRVEFADGLYWFSLKYREEVKFGDLRIRRVSKANRVIKIAAD